MDRVRHDGARADFGRCQCQVRLSASPMGIIRKPMIMATDSPPSGTEMLTATE